MSITEKILLLSTHVGIKFCACKIIYSNDDASGIYRPSLCLQLEAILNLYQKIRVQRSEHPILCDIVKRNRRYSEVEISDSNMVCLDRNMRGWL